MSWISCLLPLVLSVCIPLFTMQKDWAFSRMIIPLSMFFLPYIIFQVIVTLMLQKTVSIFKIDFLISQWVFVFVIQLFWIYRFPNFIDRLPNSDKYEASFNETIKQAQTKTRCV